jgi:hypothetical protein
MLTPILSTRLQFVPCVVPIVCAGAGLSPLFTYPLNTFFFYLHGD